MAETLGIRCFGCESEIISKPNQTQSGWTVDCEVCGVTNKLTKHTDDPPVFSASGMFVTLKREND